MSTINHLAAAWHLSSVRHPTVPWYPCGVDNPAVTTAPLQHRPPGCHHGITPASTTWLSPWHHSSVDHLAVAAAPLQLRPPGCHHGTTPASTTWLFPRCHSCTAPDFSTLPHEGDHRRSRTSPHLSPLSPVPLGWRTAACGGVCGNAAVVCGS